MTLHLLRLAFKSAKIITVAASQSPQGSLLTDIVRANILIHYWMSLLAFDFFAVNFIPKYQLRVYCCVVSALFSHKRSSVRRESRFLWRHCVAIQISAWAKHCYHALVRLFFLTNDWYHVNQIFPDSTQQQETKRRRKEATGTKGQCRGL